ncbi:hypothetical protein KXX44_000378, partial [Aspergillus fumigatus]
QFAAPTAMSSTTVGWIWPKDPRPGNPSRWPRRWRLFDVLTNRGPDIYVGKIKSRAQSQEQINWSGWECREGCCCAGMDETPFPWARRGVCERYDFRRRRRWMRKGGGGGPMSFRGDIGIGGGWSIRLA